MAFDTIFNEPFLTRPPLTFFLSQHLDPCGNKTKVKYNNFEEEVRPERQKQRRQCTMSTMYNPGDREWQTFQRRPDRIKMITSTAWFFHQHKLSPIFRKIQKYVPTLVSSTIQLRSGAKLYAALESIWIHIEKSFQAFNLQLKLSIGATKYSTQKLKT